MNDFHDFSLTPTPQNIPLDFPDFSLTPIPQNIPLILDFSNLTNTEIQASGTVFLPGSFDNLMNSTYLTDQILQAEGLAACFNPDFLLLPWVEFRPVCLRLLHEIAHYSVFAENPELLNHMALWTQLACNYLNIKHASLLALQDEVLQVYTTGLRLGLRLEVEPSPFLDFMRNQVELYQANVHDQANVHAHAREESNSLGFWMGLTLVTLLISFIWFGGPQTLVKTLRSWVFRS